MSPWRIAAALGMVAVLGVALAVVLVGDRRAVGPTAAPAATPSPSPTTSASEVASPTPSPVETTPLELATGEDWMEVARRLAAAIDAAFARRDPQLLDLAQHPSCDCRGEDEQRIRELRDRELLLVGADSIVEDVEVVERWDDDGVALRVVRKYAEARTVTEGGETVAVDPALRIVVEWALVRDPADQGWRIISSEVQERLEP